MLGNAYEHLHRKVVDEISKIAGVTPTQRWVDGFDITEGVRTDDMTLTEILRLEVKPKRTQVPTFYYPRVEYGTGATISPNLRGSFGLYQHYTDNYWTSTNYEPVFTSRTDYIPPLRRTNDRYLQQWTSSHTNWRDWYFQSRQQNINVYNIDSASAIIQNLDTLSDPVPLDPRQLLIQRNRDRARVIRRRVAERKAEELLKFMLDEMQLAEYEENSYFHVTAPDGRVFRIRKGWSGNIKEIGEDGAEIATYCVHPQIWTPDQDNMLQQLLHFQSGKHEELLEIANKW